MEDTYQLKSLLDTKKTFASFLKVNGYHDENEPDYENMDLKEFSEYSTGLCEEPYPEDRKNIIKFFVKNNISINPRTIHTKKYRNKDKKNPDLLLYFYDESDKGDKEKDNIGIMHITTFLNIAILTSSNISIFISSKNLTSASYSTLYKSFSTIDTNSDLNTVYYSKYFNENKLLDLTKYIYSPKLLQIIRGENVKTFLKENKIKPQSLKKIKYDDPFSYFHLLLKGDIICLEFNVYLSEMYSPKQLEYQIVI
jgi:DNA-directed RNA polymerase subunit H (RpoH/RPB5)